MPTEAPDPGPLAETLARTARLEYRGARFAASAGRPRGDGWIAAADLPGSPRLAELLATVAGYVGTDRGDVAASLLLESYAWAIAAPSAAALLRDGRVAELDRGAVFVRFGPTGGAERVALVGGLAAALEGDPAPAARYRADREALAEDLHGELSAHLEPLLGRLNELTGRPLEALRRSAADRLAAAVAWAGAALAERPLALSVAAALATQGGRGDPASVGFGDGGDPWVERSGCCLWWRTAAGDGSYCAGCPVPGGT